MKPVNIESPIGLDRFATWNEVIRAISASGQSAFAPVGDNDDLREADSDFSYIACNLSEDAMWLAIIRKMPDSKSN